MCLPTHLLSYRLLSEVCSPTYLIITKCREGQKCALGRDFTPPYKEVHELGLILETGTCYTAQAVLHPVILLPQPSGCWYHRQAPHIQCEKAIVTPRPEDCARTVGEEQRLEAECSRAQNRSRWELRDTEGSEGIKWRLSHRGREGLGPAHLPLPCPFFVTFRNTGSTWATMGTTLAVLKTDKAQFAFKWNLQTLQ